MIRLATILLAGTLVACSGEGVDQPASEAVSGGGAAPDMPRFGGPARGKGRGIWMGTCRNCHLLGTSGAPAVTNYPAWAPRIAKGPEALYHSALNGVKGEDGQFRMPPRGGNAQLKDEQVKLAVDYMLASVKHFHQGG